MYADLSYISPELRTKLKQKNIDLITCHRKNMQAIKLSQNDEYHLKQKNKIETLLSLLRRFDSLVKNQARSLMRYSLDLYQPLFTY